MRNIVISTAIVFMSIVSVSCGNDESEPIPTAFGKGTAPAMISGVKRQVNWVQLWQNGPKFAEFNVGATAINEYGGLYPWGGLYDQGEDYYTDCGPLPSERDVATQKWGANWRMPTHAELTDLMNRCTSTWVTSYDGTRTPGQVFRGKGDYAENSIFLPAAGSYTTYHGFEAIGKDGCYWSSDSPEQMSEGYYQGYVLLFRTTIRIGDHLPYCCYSVRAVLK